MWVNYGRVSLLGPNLVAPSLEGGGHQVERLDGDHKAASSDFHDGDDHAHRHVLISVGGAHDDRHGWTPN